MLTPVGAKNVAHVGLKGTECVVRNSVIGHCNIKNANVSQQHILSGLLMLLYATTCMRF